MTGTILLILGLFLVGMILLALEAFVIPGFGVTGISGVLIIIYTAVRAWTDLNPAWGLTLGFVALVASLSLVFWVPKSRVGRRLTLNAEIDGLSGYGEDAKRAGIAVGQRGVTSTPLRPSGFALFGDSRVEVRSDGDWLDSDIEIEVVALKDGKVFVDVPVKNA